MKLHRRRYVMLLALLAAALALVAAACGGGDDSSDATTEAATTEAPATEEAPADTGAADTGAAPGGGEELAPDPDAAEFEGATAGSGEGLKIGYISLGDSLPFVRLVSDGIKAQAEIAGAELVFCDSQVDAAKALDCVKNLKTQGVQGYINFQLFEDAAAEICAAGPQVPVISVDIHQKPCELSFMGANNVRAGEISGTAAGNFMKEKFDCEYDAVVTLETIAAGVVNEQRIGGMIDGFQSVCGEITNLRQEDVGGTIDLGREKFADVLTALPGATRIVVMSLNDDMSLGALAAAKSAGREGDVYIAGQGADPSAWCEIKNNPNWIGDTAYFPERYGEILIPNMIRAINGETIPELLYVPHELVDAANIDQVYDVTDC